MREIREYFNVSNVENIYKMGTQQKQHLKGIYRFLS